MVWWWHHIFSSWDERILFDLKCMNTHPFAFYILHFAAQKKINPIYFFIFSYKLLKSHYSYVRSFAIAIVLFISFLIGFWQLQSCNIILFCTYISHILCGIYFQLLYFGFVTYTYSLWSWHPKESNFWHSPTKIDKGRQFCCVCIPKNNEMSFWPLFAALTKIFYEIPSRTSRSAVFFSIQLSKFWTSFVAKWHSKSLTVV
jgi:hypothetical protein